MPRPIKLLLDAARERSIPKEGFSWLDRRFLRDGLADRLTGPEVLLYFFLCAVADRQGLSYFGDARVCSLLKLAQGNLQLARQGLLHHDLIRYVPPLYQVLSLPSNPAPTARSLSPHPRTIGEVLRSLR